MGDAQQQPGGGGKEEAEQPVRGGGGGGAGEVCVGADQTRGGGSQPMAPGYFGALYINRKMMTR